MVAAENKLNFGFYLAYPEMMGRRNVMLETNVGVQPFLIEDIPNNAGRRRKRIVTPFMNGKTETNKKKPITLDTVRGYFVEGWSNDLLQDIFPDFNVVPAPIEIDEREKDSSNKGGDILVLEEKNDGSYSTVLIVDVTTMCTPGLKKKANVGINPTLMAPVVSLPLGDFIESETVGQKVRIKEYFDTQILPSLLNHTYEPYKGMHNPDLFLRLLTHSLQSSSEKGAVRLFVDLSKAQDLEVKSYEQAIKKLTKVLEYLGQ